MQEAITVLLVDEDEDILEITSTFLEREDDALTVETTTRTSDALGRIRDDPDRIDCVISDYTMPERTGTEFLQAVRQEVPGMPFFLFTGRDRTELADEFDDEPITGFVRKGTGTDRYADLATEIRESVGK